MNAKGIFLAFACLLTAPWQREAGMLMADLHALRCPSHRTQKLHTLAIYLTEPFSSQLLKARSIFRWVATDITYDFDSRRDARRRRPQNPETVLATRLPVWDRKSCGEKTSRNVCYRSTPRALTMVNGISRRRCNGGRIVRSQ
jgi:hypothetical protein